MTIAITTTITPARGPADMDHIRALFTEYQQWLGVDLCFQGFDRELVDLPGKYAEPEGRLLLAREGEAIAGGVGMWPLGEGHRELGRCEMKRLYVRLPWRGVGLGRRLALAIMDAARAAGHGAMCLDTLPQLKEARALYASLGFSEVPPYYDNPIEGVTYMERALDDAEREGRAGERSAGGSRHR